MATPTARSHMLARVPHFKQKAARNIQDLPADITMKFWEYLLTNPDLGEYLIDKEKVIGRGESSLNEKVAYHLEPAILRVNKRFSAEALEVLYGRNKFYFLCMSPLRGEDKCGKVFVYRCPLTRWNSTLESYPYGIPNLDKIHSLTIIKSCMKQQPKKEQFQFMLPPSNAVSAEESRKDPKPKSLFTHLCRAISKNRFKDLLILVLQKRAEYPGMARGIYQTADEIEDDFAYLTLLRGVKTFLISDMEWSPMKTQPPRRAFGNLPLLPAVPIPQPVPIRPSESVLMDPVRRRKIYRGIYDIIRREEKLDYVWHSYLPLLAYIRIFEWFDLSGFGIGGTIIDDPSGFNEATKFNNPKLVSLGQKLCNTHPILAALRQAKSLADEMNPIPSSPAVMAEFETYKRTILDLIPFKRIDGANNRLGIAVMHLRAPIYAREAAARFSRRKVGIKCGWEGIHSVLLPFQVAVEVMGLDGKGEWKPGTGGQRGTMMRLMEEIVEDEKPGEWLPLVKILLLNVEGQVVLLKGARRKADPPKFEVGARFARVVRILMILRAARPKLLERLRLMREGRIVMLSNSGNLYDQIWDDGDYGFMQPYEDRLLLDEVSSDEGEATDDRDGVTWNGDEVDASEEQG